MVLLQNFLMTNRVKKWNVWKQTHMLKKNTEETQRTKSSNEE